MEGASVFGLTGQECGLIIYEIRVVYQSAWMQEMWKGELLVSKVPVSQNKGSHSWLGFYLLGCGWR